MLHYFILVGREEFGVPYDSTAGVPQWFTPIGLGILLYLGIRVYLALRKNKK